MTADMTRTGEICRPLRVAMFAHSAQQSGAESSFTRLLQALDRDEFAVTVLSARPGPLLTEWQASGFRAELCEQPWVIDRLSWPGEMQDATQRCRAWLERLDADLVVSNTTMLYASAKAAAELDLPLVVWTHGVMSAALWPALDVSTYRQYEKALAAIATTLVGPSDWTARHLASLAPDRRCVVVPNGVVLPVKWHPLPESVRDMQLVMLCRLEPNKQVEAVVEAIGEVRRRRPDLPVRLVHYGHRLATGLDKLQDLIAQNNLKHNVTFSGLTSDLSAAYGDAYAVVVASQVESFSNVVLEGMAHGRPVIATRCGGPESIIVDGETGILVPRNDIEALVQAIIDLASDSARARDMGLAGRRRVEERYEMTRVAGELADALKSAPYDAQQLGEAERRHAGLMLGEQAMLSHVAASAHADLRQTGPATSTTSRPDPLPPPISRPKGTHPPRILAVGNYRLPSMELVAILPFRELMRQGRCEFLFSLERDCTLAHVEWCDALLLVRPISAEAEALWRHARVMGKPMFSYWDDDLLNVPESAPSHPVFASPEVQARIPMMMRESAAIWFCNPLLGEAYGELVGKPPRVMPVPVEAISAEAAARHITEDHVLRIGYAGGIGHGEFLDRMCATALESVVEEAGDRVELYCLGALPKLLDNLPFVQIPYVGDYNDFRQYFAATGLHIGLAPLPGGAFYSRKFYNKWLEYASVGACGIFSRTPPYTDVVVDGVNGLLAGDDPSEWHASLWRLVNDAELRRYLATKAHQQTLEEHSPKVVADAYASALEEVLGAQLPDMAAPEVTSPAITPARVLPTGNIYATRPIEGVRHYHLRPEADHWNALDLFLGLHQRKASGQLVLSIYGNGLGEQPLRKVRCDLAQAEDNYWFHFSFQPLSNTRGRQLIVGFGVENPGSDTLVSIYEQGSAPSDPITRARRRYSHWGGRLYCRLGYQR